MVADSYYTPYDKLYASLQPVGSVTLPEVWTVDNTYGTSSIYWYLVTLTYNEMPYAGRPMRLYLHGTNRNDFDDYTYTNFFVDASSVQVQCARYPWLSADQSAAPVVVQIEPDPSQPTAATPNWNGPKTR